MSKKTIIILTVLVVGILAGALGIVFVLTSKPAANTLPAQQNTGALASTYVISINAFGQTVTGQLTMNGKTSDLPDMSKVDQYGLVSFNNAGDLLWFQCTQGYSISNFYSSTNNKTGQTGTQVYAVVTNNQTNNLSVTCAK